MIKLIIKTYEKTLLWTLNFTPDHYREKKLLVIKIKTAEKVFRKLFAHVMTNCGITDGYFTNPKAVLKPVNISNIPFATEIFTHANISDDKGYYIEKHPCNGVIKGLTSRDNLPMYCLYINLGGQPEKRYFIPQNPNKLDVNGNLAQWAKEVRKGAKIMILLKENSPPILHIKLEPNMKLGQEDYKIWGPR